MVELPDIDTSGKTKTTSNYLITSKSVDKKNLRHGLQAKRGELRKIELMEKAKALHQKNPILLSLLKGIVKIAKPDQLVKLNANMKQKFNSQKKLDNQAP